MDQEKMEPSAIKWDSLAYGRCLAASLTALALEQSAAYVPKLPVCSAFWDMLLHEECIWCRLWVQEMAAALEGSVGIIKALSHRMRQNPPANAATWLGLSGFVCSQSDTWTKTWINRGCRNRSHLNMFFLQVIPPHSIYFPSQHPSPLFPSLLLIPSCITSCHTAHRWTLHRRPSYCCCHLTLTKEQRRSILFFLFFFF